MTPEQQAQAACPHPPQYMTRAEHWGPLGPLLSVARCHLCGATR